MELIRRVRFTFRIKPDLVLGPFSSLFSPTGGREGKGVAREEGTAINVFPVKRDLAAVRRRREEDADVFVFC